MVAAATRNSGELWIRWSKRDQEGKDLEILGAYWKYFLSSG